jgi:perosamine synthetase
VTGTVEIPWARPEFWGHEEELVLEALRSSWVSGGPFVDRLESELAEILGARHTFAVANGTAALHLAFIAAGLRPGDEVVVPGFGFLAAANMALLMGARPVFADVDPATWCATAETIAPCIGERTRAIVPVHTYGNVCDVEPILALAADHDILVIEDAAEALFSSCRGRMAGTVADLGTFSFQATKTITTGEGGLVATDDDAFVDALRLYRSHGMAGPRRYWHHVPGHNFRLTNLQAALGCGQLAHREEIVAARRLLHERYAERLADVPGVEVQLPTPGCDMVLWAMTVRLDPEAFPDGRDAVMAAMTQDGIETRPGFYPPSAIGLYGDIRAIPVAEAVAASTLSLPSFPALTQSDVDRVCASLQRARA